MARNGLEFGHGAHTSLVSFPVSGLAFRRISGVPACVRGGPLQA